MTQEQQDAYWRDYRKYYLGSFLPRGIVSPVRRRLALGTRLRKAGILKRAPAVRPEDTPC
jgi:hypothetical protein